MVGAGLQRRHGPPLSALQFCPELALWATDFYILGFHMIVKFQKVIFDQITKSNKILSSFSIRNFETLKGRDT